MGQRQRSEAGNQFVFITTDKYTQPTRVLPTTKITSTQVSNIFFNDWIIPYGVPDTVLSDGSQHLVCKFFTSLCSYIGAIKLTTTAFYPQTKGHVDRYKKTLVYRQWLYIADNQMNWSILTEPRPYVYNCHVHRSTAGTPFPLFSAAFTRTNHEWEPYSATHRRG